MAERLRQLGDRFAGRRRVRPSTTWMLAGINIVVTTSVGAAMHARDASAVVLWAGVTAFGLGAYSAA